MDKAVRAGQVWLAYLEVFALVNEGVVTSEQARPILSALDKKWRTLQEQYIVECNAAAHDAEDADAVDEED